MPPKYAPNHVLGFIPEKVLMDRKRNASTLCSTLPMLQQNFSEKSCTNVVNKNTRNKNTCLALKKAKV